MGTSDRPGLAPGELEERILAFLHRELLDPGVTVGPEVELLSGGLLNSVRVLRLATFVEEEFRFKIQPADFVIENFQTVAVLAAYVRRAVGDGERPSTRSE